MGNVKVQKGDDGFIAPDGGWGWIIVIAAGFSNMLILSNLQTFGLTFKDRLEELQFSVKDIVILMSVNSSFGMIMGIFTGPFLKRFGYRKPAFVGGIFFVSGLFYTPFAETFVEYLICYAMLSSLGVSVTMTSFSLALNTYFKRKRSIAAGFSMTIMGMGPIGMPFLVTHLLGSYGWKWTVLLTAALTLNIFIGVFLLQPIKWHVKKENADVEEGKRNKISHEISLKKKSGSLVDFGGSFLNVTDLGVSQLDIKEKKWKSQSNLQNKWNQRTDETAKKGRSISSLDNEDYGDMMKSTLHVLNNSAADAKDIRYASVESLDRDVCKDAPYESDKLLNEDDEVKCIAPDIIPNKVKQEHDLTERNVPAKETGIIGKVLKYFKKLYDLDLFLDPIYINLLLGLSAASIAEIVFSVMMPFILSELGLNLQQIALFMSVSAVTDVVSRCLSPYCGKLLNFNSRVMYLLSITSLLCIRFSLYVVSSPSEFIMVAVAYGVSKGFRSVYWTLVLPDYVPLSKLPSAGAFQNLCNGLSLIIFGPVIGFIISRSSQGYTNVILGSNVMTLITIIMWTTEFIITYYRRRN